MKLQLTNKIAQSDGHSIVFFTADGFRPSSLGDTFSHEERSIISRLAETSSHRQAFKGKLGQRVVYREVGSSFFQHLIFIGLQKDGLGDSECFRRAAANLISILKREKFNRATIHLGPDIKRCTIQAIVEGLVLASYELKEFISAKDDEPFEIERIDIYCEAKGIKESDLQVSRVISESVNFARRLGDLPPGHLTPKEFACIVKRSVRALEIKFTEWDQSRLVEERMTGLLTVSRGSNEEPRMVILRYSGSNTESPPVCLVGKGITFDAGGLNIKSTKNMEDMRYDMSGAAAVVAATMAIAKLKIPINLVAYAALAENMPGPAAVKPGDIYTARNGKTIEVMNTDAEGRLVLADALCLAQDENPQAIINIATLTGGVLAALGDVHTGVFCNQEKIYQALSSAAEFTEEMIWRLPLASEHVEDIKGQFADISNQSIRSGASSATAAAFLAQFVPNSTPWVHLDIAGTAQHVGHRLPYAPKKGASGAMVRTLIRFIENSVNQKESLK